MKINNWLLSLGICFFFPLNLIATTNRCIRPFIDQIMAQTQVYNPPHFQEAASFRTDHFSLFYPEAYYMQNDSVFNRTLVTEKKAIVSREDRWIFSYLNPVLTGVFVIPQGSDYSSYEFVGPREFSLNQFSLSSPHSNLAVSVHRNFDIHEINVEVPAEFPAERSHLSLSNFLRQIDFAEDWSSQLHYNFSSPESEFHLRFYNWSRIMSEGDIGDISEFDEMLEFVDEVYRIRSRSLTESYRKKLIDDSRDLARRSISVVNRSSESDESQINGTMTLVLSKGPEEPLLFEALEERLYREANPEASEKEVQDYIRDTFEIDRKKGKTYAELGRLAVAKGDRTGIAAMLMQNLPALAQGIGIEEIFAFADRVHRPLYEQFGFKVYKEVQSEGRPYWVLKVDARAAFYRALAIYNAVSSGDNETLQKLEDQGIRLARTPGRDTYLNILDDFEGMYPPTLADIPWVREKVTESVNKDRWEAGMPPLPGTEFDELTYEREQREHQERIELMFMEGPELLDRLRSLGRSEGQ